MDSNQVSPTGLPYINPKLVPYLAALVAAAGLALQFLKAGSIEFQVCSGIVALGGILGIVSPGARKVQDAEAAGAKAEAAAPAPGLASVAKVEKLEDFK